MSIRTSQLSCVILVFSCLVLFQTSALACRPPAKRDIYSLAQVKEEFPPEVEVFLEFRIKVDDQPGRQGHWVHISAQSPAMGMLLWKPCGAPPFDPVKTGGFVSWRWIQLGDKRGLALTSESFGTGYEVRPLTWYLPQGRKVNRIFEVDLFERVSAEKERIIRTSITSSRSTGKWGQKTVTTSDGRVTSIKHKQLCLSLKKNNQVMSVEVCK